MWPGSCEVMCLHILFLIGPEICSRAIDMPIKQSSLGANLRVRPLVHLAPGVKHGARQPEYGGCISIYVFQGKMFKKKHASKSVHLCSILRKTLFKIKMNNSSLNDFSNNLPILFLFYKIVTNYLLDVWNSRPAFTSTH